MTPAHGVSLRKMVSSILFPRYSSLIDRMNWSARWMETIRRSSDCPIFPSREEMYRHVDAEYFSFADAGARQPIDFFEFGVFEGRSLASWRALNDHPESRFFGFDSFEGLPEEWNPKAPAGRYSANGKIPQADDPRVQFVVGWFQSSLPGFLASYEARNPLVIHNDSDLYSSTLYCLTTLNALITPGTLIIFDEFYDPLHEYRALHDYSAAYMRKYDVVAATREFHQAAVRIT